ncbi:MAG: glycerol-3-phosphate dehydrogenase [Deltaproteobacteria bacterium]|nr:glycerol-3-phosphate dehydrogenase [Deltaproteobacteria bacterium]
MAKVVVVGAGMMGTALCTPLADAGHEVRLVGTHLDGAWIAALKADRCHPKLGVPLPDGVTPFGFEEIRAAMTDVEVIAVGVSSAGVRWAAHVLAPFLRRDLPLIAVTKGLEESPPGALRVLPDVFSDELPATLRGEVAPAAIGGPCIAGEIARRVPTSVVFCGRDRATLDYLAVTCATPYYHVHVSTDLVGVEVCAALKNSYAMAVGIGAGVHERLGGAPGPVAHHNYEAAIFAQACLEMDLLVRACGGDPRQVPHLAGAGDLLVTTSGGRSSRLGRLLGLGLSFEDARAQMAGDTLESADTVRVVGGALPRLYASGRLAPGSLPLMEHLQEIIALGRPVDMPFGRFFGEPAAP